MHWYWKPNAQNIMVSRTTDEHDQREISASLFVCMCVSVSMYRDSQSGDTKMFIL